MKKSLLSLMLMSAAAYADFDMQQWKSKIPITLTPGKAVSEFSVTSEVFRRSSARLDDLRIIGNDGSEIPYLIQTLTADVRHTERSVPLLDKAWTKGKGVQATLDLQGHEAHNRLRIQSPDSNFKQAVQIETSNDAQHWSTVLSDGLIFHIARPEVNVSNLTVAYPTSTRRYVRLTIPEWTEPASLESVWIADYQESAATREDLGTFKPAVTQDAKAQTTGFVFDLGYIGQPCDRLILQVEPALFSRMAAISSSNDGKMWRHTAGAYISRTASEEHLKVEFGESWDRFIKLTVFNGDSSPVRLRSATASAVRRMVRFPTSEPGPYWFYLDSISARAPVYDFARVDDASQQAGVARLGAAEANPEYQASKAPYSERNPWVLNAILGVAAIIMAMVIYRFARKATSPAA